MEWKIDSYHEELSEWDSFSKIAVRKIYKGIFKEMLPAAEETQNFIFPQGYCYLFYGPKGSGKKTMARAYAKELLQQGFQFVSLYGAELQGESREETKQILDCFVKEILSGSKYFVLLEGIEAFEKESEICMLARSLKKIRKERKSIVVVVVEKDDKLSPMLCSLFTAIPFSYPDEEEREEYFKLMRQRFFSYESNFTEKDMAKLTENFSYYELDIITLFVKAYRNSAANWEEAVLNKDIFERMIQMAKRKTENGNLENLQPQMVPMTAPEEISLQGQSAPVAVKEELDLSFYGTEQSQNLSIEQMSQIKLPRHTRKKRE